MIVGAGLAGVSAASRLIENGLDDLIVLEAENRIGGRIHSIPFANGFIDYGAQFCHGEEGNAIYEMTHNHFEFGRSEFMVNPNEYVVSNGTHADQELCSLLYGLLTNITEHVENANGSLGSHVKTEYMNAFENDVKYKVVDRDLALKMLKLQSRDVAAYYAADSWDEISINYQVFAKESGGNQLLSWKSSGFKTVFDFITVSFVKV